MTAADVVSWSGLALTLVGTAVAALGIRDTWRQFRPEGARFWGPFYTWADRRILQPAQSGPFDAFDIPSLPVAVTVFPAEIYRAPRTWGEQSFGNLIYWNEVDKGGHFAAWEQPELFSEELRAAFRSLR